MQAIFNVLLRLILLVAGLVFAASLLFVAVLFMLLWGLRAVWARLTGQPVSPFIMRVDPRTGFGQVFRTRPSQAPPQEGPSFDRPPARPRCRHRGRRGQAAARVTRGRRACR
jgi:hypothetical protein